MTSDEHYLEYGQLLRDLKRTVEVLLNSQVANVWYVYGGLNRLHVDLDKIFKHGCKLTNDKNETDYWRFIQAVEWLQPDPSNSTFSLDCVYNSHFPQAIKNNKASIWLYNSLENHTLSQKLSWLLSDNNHLLDCYQLEAFLCQDCYAEAVLLCLRAIERNQPSLISEIKPNLYLNNGRAFITSHRRTISLPDNHIKTEKLPTVDVPLMEQEEKDLQIKRVMGKSKLWSSMPNLLMAVKNENDTCRSKTLPTTPLREIKHDSGQKFKTTLTPKQVVVKHVLFNDVVEYTVHEVDPVTEPQCSSAPEFNFLGSIAGISGEKDHRKKPKKTFIEDGGMSVLPMSTAYFPRPAKGQTLVSYLTYGFSSTTAAELDRENAHFNISEAVISAMEQLKCRKLEHESDEEISDLKQRIRLRKRHRQKVSQPKAYSDSTLGTSSSISSTCTSLSSDEIEDVEMNEASNLMSSNQFSMSMASLYSEADLMHRPRGAPDGASSDVMSAEDVALSLISKFSENQLPRASEFEWLVSEKDAPQSLLPLPSTFLDDDYSTSVTSSLRGTQDWAPPRPQIIFTLHNSTSRKDLIKKQNFRCAGCGMKVAPKYTNTFRYCEYLGRYFCTGCHTNQSAVIPARIIQNWNFNRYVVSSFSYRLLEQMYTDPLFRIFDINKNIGKHSKNLVICRKYRHGLRYLKDFIFTCRFAETEQDCLNSFSKHTFNEPDVYSIEDLVNIQTGEMKRRLKFVADFCCKHVADCQLCTNRGFICEICKDENPIFPWQMKIVYRCSNCGTCFHLKCCKKLNEVQCPRCVRLTKRRTSQQFDLIETA